MTAIILFIIAITALVFVHEFGHYIVARYFGVKVLRFSIGFGSPLLSKTDSKGTEWVFSAIPLGGYVTMWDHLNSKSKDSIFDVKSSYSNQSFFARSAIVLGGPLANFIFALVAFTCIFSFESYKTFPIIDTPLSGSISSNSQLKKNDTILRLNGSEINSFEDIESQLNNFIYHSEPSTPLELDLLRVNGEKKKISLKISEIEFNQSEIASKKIGLLPLSTGVKVVEVKDQSIADTNGLKKGDVIISINGKNVNFPSQVTEIINKNKLGSLEINFIRSDIKPNQNIVPDDSSKKNTVNIIFDDFTQVLGVYLVANTQKFKSSLSPIEALSDAFNQTLRIVEVCFTALYRIFNSGSIKDQIGGPISIAYAAETSANSGVLPFIGFLAFLSVSIGVINLLPIPILDGGHLLYHVIELIKGSPLSASFKLIGTWFGLFFIFGITFYAISNDILRYFKL